MWYSGYLNFDGYNHLGPTFGSTLFPGWIHDEHDRAASCLAPAPLHFSPKVKQLQFFRHSWLHFHITASTVYGHIQASGPDKNPNWFTEDSWRQDPCCRPKNTWHTEEQASAGSLVEKKNICFEKEFECILYIMCEFLNKTSVNLLTGVSDTSVSTMHVVRKSV